MTSDLIPSLIEDLTTTLAPYILFITDVLPLGMAIFSGVVSCLHLWKKYKLTSLQLKKEEEEQNNK